MSKAKTKVAVRRSRAEMAQDAKTVRIEKLGEDALVDSAVADATPRVRPERYLNDATCSRCGYGIECIDVVQHLNFNRGNVIKYVWRAGKKDPSKTIEDLKKAREYIDFEIARLEKAESAEARPGLTPDEWREGNARYLSNLAAKGLFGGNGGNGSEVARALNKIFEPKEGRKAFR